MFEIITDASLGLEKTNEYILSIQVSLGGFSFSVINPKGNQLLTLKQTPLKISDERFIARRFREWIETERIVHRDFCKTRIVVETEKFTIIPESFYVTEKNEGILHLLTETEKNQEICETRVESQDARLLFILPHMLKDVVASHFRNFTFLHPVKLFLEKLPEINKENGLILLFSSTILFVGVFNKVKLILANSFKITHSNDVLFFVLTVLKQLRINPHDAGLFIGGETQNHPKMLSDLERYFDRPVFLNPSPEIQIAQGLFDGPLYPFYSILTLAE
jgi:hypothetical protein